MALTDEQWAMLEPLVEAWRPHAKVLPQHLRRTIGAIIWRHHNGAKWRALPDAEGPWWMAAQTFIRWSRLGVWERLLTLAQERGVGLGMTFLDGTSIRSLPPSPAYRSGWWGTAATPATSSASTSGTLAHGPPFGPSGTRLQSPVRTGSTTTATASNASGPGSRVQGTALNRAGATQYEKTASSFLGVLHLAATIDWLKR